MISGSIAALIACTDISPESALQMFIDVSKEPNILDKIDVTLKTNILKILSNSHIQMCNNRLHIVVTKVMTPQSSPIILNHFQSPSHLVDCIAASCFIPVYSARRLSTSINMHTFTNSGNYSNTDIKNNINNNSSGNHNNNIIFGKNLYADGGLTAFMPPVGDVRVSPFPHAYVKRFFKQEPHIHIQEGEFPLTSLLKWYGIYNMFCPNPVHVPAFNLAYRYN